MKYYVYREVDNYRLIETVPPHKHLIVKVSEFDDFKKQSGVELIDVELRRLSSLFNLFDYSVADPATLEKISFGKLSESELSEYMCHKVLNPRESDVIWWDYDDVCTAVDLSSVRFNEQTIIAYYNDEDYSVTIKSDADFILLTGDDLFSGFWSLVEIDFTGTFSCLQYYSDYFSNCEKLKKLDLTTFDFSICTDMSKMFYFCTNLEELIINKNVVYKNVEKFDELFSFCAKLTSIDLSMFKFVTEFSKELEMLTKLTQSENCLKSYVSQKLEINFLENNVSF